MNRLKSSTLFALSILVAGCTTQSAVMKPPTGDVISIIHYSLSEHTSGRMFVFQDDYDCYGIEPQLPDQTSELLIERKRYTTFALRWFDEQGGTQCDMAFSLTTGNELEFALISEYSEESGCYVEAWRKVAEEWVPAEIFRRDLRPLVLSKPGPYCEADPIYQGSSLYVVPRGGQ